MKIYEKPMAIIEAIEVEDVITASGSVKNQEVEDALKSQLNLGATDEVILFKW